MKRPDNIVGWFDMTDPEPLPRRRPRALIWTVGAAALAAPFVQLHQWEIPAMTDQFLVAAALSCWAVGAISVAVSVNVARRAAAAKKAADDLETAIAERVADLSRTNNMLRDKLSLHVAKDKAEAATRSRIARAGGLARAAKVKAAREADGGKSARATLSAFANSPLRPRDEVVADVRAAREARTTQISGAAG